MSEVKVNKISPRTNCGTTQLGDAGDTITVTGDLKSNSLKSASGSTITLGQSGDTIQLGCGASQTGFGRTGTVDWDTTAKTAAFTAVSGNGYFVNTTSGAITMNLPATPSAGDIVSIKDYAYTFGTNNFTVNGNGSPIGGVAGIVPVTYTTNGTSKTFIYVDGTKGWLVTNESTDTSQESSDAYIVATGGTITTCGDYKIHTFTGPGTFCVSAGAGPVAVVDYLVVAGGGNGGGQSSHGGGGGAGGYRESSGAASGCYSASPLGSCVSAITVTATAYPITVGAGGAKPIPGTPSENPANANPGSNSIFSTITSTGGGAGGGDGPGSHGDDGGSGGGSGGTFPGNGLGNTPPVSPPQGNPGGTSTYAPPGYGTGGGGGATGTGAPGTTSAGGAGGAGATSSINASSVTRAGGGGGSTFDIINPGPGGSGGGGPGGTAPTPGIDGTTNTGGGGGGGSYRGGTVGDGGAGGSGIVIIRYRYQ